MTQCFQGIQFEDLENEKEQEDLTNSGKAKKIIVQDLEIEELS